MVKNASALTRHARCSVVESTESRERDNISVLSGLDEASPGRITVERHVGPVVVVVAVVARVRAHASQEVKLIEHDEVIDAFILRTWNDVAALGPSTPPHAVDDRRK